MSILKLPRSVRKYIRLQKALIRRGVLDMAEQSRLISALYKKISETYQKKQQKPANKQDNIISAAAEKVLPVKQ